MVTLYDWVSSAEVMDKVILLPTLALAVFFELLELMVTLDNVGAVVSTVKELTGKAALGLPLLVTVTVQL